MARRYTNQKRFTPGDIVKMAPNNPGLDVYRHELWEVVKVNPSRYKLCGVASGTMLNVYDSHIVKATDIEAETVRITKKLKGKSAVVRFQSGTVVEWEHDSNWYVVLRQRGLECSMVLLGGSDRHYTGIPVSQLTDVKILDYFDE